MQFASHVLHTKQPSSIRMHCENARWSYANVLHFVLDMTWAYLLGLLAMIKCSICSYQCDNWYVSNWRLACHSNFCLGWCHLELAQVPTSVALALHLAGRSTPFGVTCLHYSHRRTDTQTDRHTHTLIWADTQTPQQCMHVACVCVLLCENARWSFAKSIDFVSQMLGLNLPG